MCTGHKVRNGWRFYVDCSATTSRKTPNRVEMNLVHVGKPGRGFVPGRGREAEQVRLELSCCKLRLVGLIPVPFWCQVSGGVRVCS